MDINDARDNLLCSIYTSLNLVLVHEFLNEPEHPLWGAWRHLEDVLTKMDILEDDDEIEDEDDEIEEDPAGAYADYLYDLWKDKQIMDEIRRMGDVQS